MTVDRRVACFAAMATGALAVVACGGGGDSDDEQRDPLDIVRDQLERAGSAPVVSTSGTPSSAPATAVEELPLPDDSAFVGRHRVVNLWAGPGGTMQVIDVWARRTFTNGPVLLASGLGFGDSSAYFAAPVNHNLVVVGAGAGPDGLELAGMFNAGDGEQITTVFTNDDETGSIWAPNLFEVDPGGANAPPAPPADGTGLVYLYAPNIGSFESSLALAIGAAVFSVGDGSGACARQRIEDGGFAPHVLGGTQNVQLDLPPGPARLTLHAWPSADGCSQPSLLDLDVEVVPGSGVLVLVFSRDGDSIAALQLPMPLG